MTNYWCYIIVLVHGCIVLSLKCSVEIDSYLLYLNDSEARCLDGSFPGVFYRPASTDSPNQDKWHIHFEGGGWSFSSESLVQRSGTIHGSSSKLPKMMSWKLFVGYENIFLKRNPLMCDWHHIYVPYCDSSSFAGDATIVVGDQTYYVHGLKNRNEMIRKALDLGMRKASEVVISGCSAGGLAVYLGIDDMAETIAKANKSTLVVGLADSGYFMRHPRIFTENYFNFIRRIYHQYNMSIGANADCVKAETEKSLITSFTYSPSEQCVFASTLARYIKTPLFALQSRYDSWQINHILGPNSSNERKTTFGRNMSISMMDSLLKYLGNDPENALINSPHGLFLDSCHRHCLFCPTVRDDLWNGENLKEERNQLTPAHAFHIWYEYTKEIFFKKMTSDEISKLPNYHVFQQIHDFPCRQCCKC